MFRAPPSPQIKFLATPGGLLSLWNDTYQNPHTLLSFYTSAMNTTRAMATIYCPAMFLAAYVIHDVNVSVLVTGLI